MHPICNYKVNLMPRTSADPEQNQSSGVSSILACDKPSMDSSKMISCVVASAAEAELAAGFQLAQIAVRLRNTLHDFGYPQQPTLLLIDNTVAIGLANDSINKKRSKSMDMRFLLAT